MGDREEASAITSHLTTHRSQSHPTSVDDRLSLSPASWGALLCARIPAGALLLLLHHKGHRLQSTRPRSHRSLNAPSHGPIGARYGGRSPCALRKVDRLVLVDILLRCELAKVAGALLHRAPARRLAGLAAAAAASLLGSR